jgi:hypothetical protein
MRTPEDLIRLYEEGIYAEGEVATVFITSAGSKWLPEQFIPILPPQILKYLSDDVMSPPKFVEDVEFFHGSTAQQRLDWFNGAWNLHRYLLANKN